MKEDRIQIMNSSKSSGKLRTGGTLRKVETFAELRFTTPTEIKDYKKLENEILDLSNR